MSTRLQGAPGGAQAPPDAAPNSLTSLLFRIVLLAVIDAMAIWIVYRMVGDGYWPLAAVLIFITIGLNIVFLSGRMYPLRYIAPGLALMIIMVLYPILFTVYVSFTNYGQGHLVSKQDAIGQIESQTYLPEDAAVYSWTAYQNPATNAYMLWMTNPDTGESFTVTEGEAPVARSGEAPAQIDDFVQVPQNQLFSKLTEIAAISFGLPPDQVFQVSQTRIGQAAQYESLYTYDAAQDAMLNQQTGELYRNVNGVYASESGQQLSPGFATPVGVNNYQRLFGDPALRSSFLLVFLWTLIFAALSVLFTFALGMFLAIMFDVPEMPLRAPLRSLLLIPYTIPAFVAVPVWVGLLNPQFGIISETMYTLIGWAPPWFSDPFWAKVGVLLVQLWLGFPYMFVVVTGALQTLPKDIYEAADIDGANAWNKFRSMTLPLLLVTVGPLLVASFAFNFNNFTVIDLYARGGPPMTGVSTPVGHTDILATYTYRIAFGSTGRSDYGYASAITMMIFIILFFITQLQFRYTNMLEERGRNV
ncbi:MAG: ABC transporter permease subunit [Caldilineaceae bacterium]|nr:ABC transporter permease subunit [Caldilineaceae bacterium]